MTAKALHYGLTIVLVLTLNFLLPRLMPGNPLGDLDTPEGLPVPLTPDQKAKLMAHYHLDAPLSEQFCQYVAGIAKGDLGWSISYNAPVLQVLLARLRWTALLVGTSTVVYVALGIALGAVSAWRHGGALDTSLLGGTLALASFPSYFLAMLLVMLFGVKLRVLPLGGAQTAALLHSPWDVRLLDIARHAALPAAALILTSVGDIFYITRNSLSRVMGDPFIATARAKGLPERLILFRHVLPNALLPVVSLVAMRLGFVVMGAMMVEVTFAYPGMGQALYQATISRDYPLLQGGFLFTMLSILGFNLLADILYTRLDPRVRSA